jgi:hypothetical protein
MDVGGRVMPGAITEAELISKVDDFFLDTGISPA